MKITRAYLIREDGPDVVQSDSDFSDITAWFDPAAPFPECIRESFPYWKAWRLEMRYSSGGQKFRDIYRDTDVMDFPPEIQEDAKGPRGILSATLDGRDITARVKKYAGPNGDFGGRTVRVADLFPMEDPHHPHDENSTLKIVRVDTHTGLCVVSYDVESNPVIS